MALQTWKSRGGLTLPSMSARELMVADPVSLPRTATIRGALNLLTAKGLDAAPVINDAGRPVGVVSESDILTHISEQQFGVRQALEAALIADIMTPVVISIVPDAPAERVVEEMVAHKVQRLYVVDGAGILLGVIGAMDVLRHLQTETSLAAHQG